MSTYAPFAKPLYVMLKPVGAVCNLACDYCYYLEKSKLHVNNPKHVMSDELLENWMEAEKILRENEIFEANNSYQMREKMKQYLERMLAFFEEQNQNPNYYAVYQVKTYLQKHCSESADIEKLAAEVGLSPNYLRSLFKEATGKTILEYNTEMRLQRAAELLKNKKNKVREVSLAVGYENVSYFGVVFQKRFGVTPNEYRKMV